MPPDSPARIKPVAPDLEIDLDHEPSGLPTPRFDLEPYARANAEDASAMRPEPEESQVRAHASDEEIALTKQMWDAFAATDFATALDCAHALLALNPRHAVANACAEEFRADLETQLAQRLGAPHATPRVIASSESIAQSPLDHRQGFVLSQIDGTITIGTLIDVCGMDTIDLLRALDSLRAAGLVALG